MISTDDGQPHLRIEANPLRVRAMFAGHVIADTTDALTVHEPGRRPVHFFPRRDVETSYFGRTSRLVHEPLKGDGACYTLRMEGEIVEAAAYSFDDPPPDADALRGHLCLAPDHFEIYELTPADMAMAPRASHAHTIVT